MENGTESVEMEQMLNVFFEKTVSLFDLIPSNFKGLYHHHWLESVKYCCEEV